MTIRPISFPLRLATGGLSFVRSDGELKVHREPIVAWEMRPGTDRPKVNPFAHPVTVGFAFPIDTD